MTLFHQFKAHWDTSRFATPGRPVLLAVSGGMDSMVMADLFLSAGLPVAVAHCNFGLRGADADMDEQLVQQWCEKNSIKFHVIKFATKQKAQEWKKGTQETARILRYEWFELVRQEHHYAKIATAHHANDNVETLLINLFKGTGISGLHGILPDSNNIIRPMLFADRETIAGYASTNNIAYREDASNQTDDYLRNAVRHNIIPVAKKLFPSLIKNVNESIGRFAETEVLYHKAIEQETKKLLEQRGNDHYIPIRKLEKRQPLATICYELLQPFGFTPGQLPHVLSLLSAETGHYVSSATHRVIRNRDFLIITTIPAEGADLIVIEGAPCAIDTGRYTFSFSIRKKPNVIPTDINEACIDLQHVEFPIILRKWRTGDYLYPLGMGMKKKKVSRLLIDGKVPLHEKEEIRILECSRRVAWVSGIRLDERFKIKGTTEKVLVVKRTPRQA
jgi:tRNA(Ile)-lysidine synthase